MKRAVLILMAVTGLFAMSKKVKILNINGELGVYGNMPHTFMAIKDMNGDLYKIDNPKDFNLLKMQNQTIKVKAALLEESKSRLEPKEIRVLEIIK